MISNIIPKVKKVLKIKMLGQMWLEPKNQLWIEIIMNNFKMMNLVRIQTKDTKSRTRQVMPSNKMINNQEILVIPCHHAIINTSSRTNNNNRISNHNNIIDSSLPKMDRINIDLKPKLVVFQIKHKRKYSKLCKDCLLFS